MVSLLTNLLAFGRIWRSWLIVPSAVLGSLSTIIWLPFLAFVCGWIYQRLQGISILKPSDCEVLFGNPRAVLLPLLAGICVSYELLNRVYMSLGLWLKRGVRFESLLFDWDAGVFEHVENMGAVLALAMWTTWGVGVLPYIILVMEALLLAARERVQRQEARKEATSDPLTGLASARGLSEAIQKRLQASKKFALLYLDMDGFKQVNDRYGHAVGDMLLIQVAEVLKSNIASADLVGRRGGDEFVIVLAEQDRAGAEQVRTELRQVIEIALQHDRRFASVSFSGGISLYPNDGLSEGVLLDAADQAMYAEKQLRRRAAA